MRNNNLAIQKHKEELKLRHRELLKKKQIVVETTKTPSLPIETVVREFREDPKIVSPEDKRGVTTGFYTDKSLSLDINEDSTITCIAASGNFLYVATKSGTITLYRVIHQATHGKQKFTYEKLKKHRLENVDGTTFAIKILLDERADLLFYIDAMADKIYILSMTTMEPKNQYQDLMEKYPYFKSGVINLQQKFTAVCLDVEKNVIAFQTEDKVCHGYQYARREHANRLVQTPFMEQAFQHPLKEICTTIFLCQDILIVHFEQSTQIHIYSLKRRRKSKISTKGEDNKPIWNQISDVPQIIYLQPIGLNKSLCIFKNLEDVEMIYLDATDGAISQYTKPYRDVHFSVDPKCKEIALCFPYVGAICQNEKEETYVEIKNLFDFDEKLKSSEIVSPPIIGNYKNLVTICSSNTRIYVADDKRVYPIEPPTYSSSVRFYDEHDLTEHRGVMQTIKTIRILHSLELKRTNAMELFHSGNSNEAMNQLYDILMELMPIKESREDKIKISYIIEDFEEIISAYPELDKLCDFQKRLHVNHLTECLFCGKSDEFSWNPKIVVPFLQETCSIQILAKYLKFLIESEKVNIRFYHDLYANVLIDLCRNDMDNQTLRSDLIAHIEGSTYYDRLYVLDKLTKYDFSYELSFVQALIDQSYLESTISPENTEEQPNDMIEAENVDSPDEDASTPGPVIAIFNEEDQQIETKKSSKLMRLVQSTLRKKIHVDENKQNVRDDDVSTMTDDEFNHIMDMFLTEQGIMNEKSRHVFHSLPKIKKVVIYENWREEKRRTGRRRATIVDIKSIEPAPLPKIKESQFIKEFDTCLNDLKVEDEKIRQIMYMLSLDKKIVLLEQHKKEKKLEEKRRIEDEKKRKQDEKIQQKEELMTDEEVNRKMASVADKLGVQGDARKKFLELPRDQKLVILKQHKLLVNFTPTVTSSDVREAQHIDREYTGFTVNFNSVFTVKRMRDGFLKHLKLEANSEPFEFLLEFTKMSNDKSLEAIERFCWLTEEFIVAKAPKEINIFGGDRQKVLKIRNDYLRGREWTLKETPTEVMEKIRKTLYNDLRLDVFPRFMSSKLGYDCICENVANPNVISKDPLFAVMYKMRSSQYSEDKNLEKETELMERASNYCNIQRYKEFLDFTWIEEIAEEFRTKTTVPIKILMVPEPEEKQVKTEGFKSLFRSFSVLNQDQEQEFTQYYYSALMVGPNWIFEWNETDLCTPRVFNPKEEVIQFEIESAFKIADLLSNMNDFLGTIIDWNSRKKYESEGGDKKKVGNSQDFVEALLRSLGVRMILPFYSPCHEEMVKQVKEKGVTKLFFTTTAEFRKKFLIKRKELSVKTHEGFDDFVNGMQTIDPDLKIGFPGEWAWLRSVDRMFWIRYKNLIEKCQPISSPSVKDMKEKRRSLKLVPLLTNHDQTSSHLNKEKERVRPSDNCPFKDLHQ